LRICEILEHLDYMARIEIEAMTPDEEPGAPRRSAPARPRPSRATPLPKPLAQCSADEVFGWVKQNGW
jgi:hypothetical protein